MSQRVLLIVIDSPASSFHSQWDALLTRGLHGALQDCAGASPLFNPDWLHAIAAARLSKIGVGNEWLAAAPARYRCLAVGEDGARLRVTPTSAHTRVQRQFDDAGISTDKPAAIRRIEAAEVLSLNEPWDFMALYLPVAPEPDAAAECAPRVGELLANQSPDIAQVLLQFSGAESRWMLQAPGIPSAADSQKPRPVQDLIATVLGLLNVDPPKTLGGTRVDASDPSTPNAPYSADDEREIQKRLEDLGYL